MSKRMMLCGIAALCLGSSGAYSDVITDWDERAIAFVTPRMPPPQAQRVLAIVNAAMFDAVNSIEPRYQPYTVQVPNAKGASKEAAAATAAAAVLGGLHPAAETEFQPGLDAYLATLPEGAAKSDGIKVGRSVAATILDSRKNDGASSPDSYQPRTTPGVYVPTAPVVASMWSKVRPFALKEPAQFRPEPPAALASEQWLRDYNEIKDFGAKASSKRSERQTEDARFWLITGPQAYHPVARQLVAAKKMDVVDSARFMTMVAIAEADALIAVLEAKYHYNFWRPVTAVRNGGGHPAGIAETTWQPLDNTPMHPEYPCAHCICGAALAAVTESLFGTADVPEITMSSTTAPGVTHRWNNLWALSKEVSEARIWAGFHYRFSIQAGEQMGRRVGEYVAKTVMQPAKVADAR